MLEIREALEQQVKKNEQFKKSCDQKFVELVEQFVITPKFLSGYLDNEKNFSFEAPVILACPEMDYKNDLDTHETISATTIVEKYNTRVYLTIEPKPIIYSKKIFLNKNYE